MTDHERRPQLSDSATRVLAYIEARLRERFTGEVRLRFHEGGLRDWSVTTQPELPEAESEKVDPAA